MRDAQQLFYKTFNAQGIDPDGGNSQSWDPTLIIIDALRHVGTNATPKQILDYIEGLKHYPASDGYYDFSDGSSGTVAVVGLISDERVASITLTRNGKPDAQAVLGAGTFVIPAMIGLSETSSRTYLVACDAAGNALERLPYRQTS